MFNLPKGDLTKRDTEARLTHTTPAERIGPSIDEGVRAVDEAEQNRGNVRRGVIALLVIAGVIAASYEASKYQLPTASDVEKWTADNLHGQLFKK